ncbi:MAG TPA: hypothetical protein VHC45_08075 [Gaiellaceae bacterium]|jgi:hypothetical protein|nr:hypothetical protein [Gaiellaceae bacterium]
MATMDELLTDLLATAKEQLRWSKASVLPGVRSTIESSLGTSQQRRAYEMCDGVKTSKDIAAAVGASPASLSNWTRRWRDLGIAYETPEGRIQHLASLATLGVPLEVEGT